MMFRNFAVMSVLAFSAGCVSVASRWNEAQQVNTVTAYEGFVRAYPNTTYVSQAKHRIEQIREAERIQYLAKARKSHSVEAYEDYLKHYPEGVDSDQLRKEDLPMLREWEPRKRLGELLTSLCPVMKVHGGGGGGLSFTGTASGEYINFMGQQGATLEQQVKEKDVIPEIERLLQAGVDPNSIRINGFVPPSRTAMGFAVKVSSGSPGVVVPASQDGMTLLEYCNANKFVEVAEFLKAHNAK